jgi:predicted GTPase
LKLFYAAQTTGDIEASETDTGTPETLEIVHAKQTSRRARGNAAIHVPAFVLFVNDPQLMTEAYRRYLEARIREGEEYRGLPIILTVRARAQKGSVQSRGSHARRKQKATDT